MFSHCFCVQGEKGEPGLIVGPDGNPLYLDGLVGQQVIVSITDFCLTVNIVLLPPELC